MDDIEPEENEDESQAAEGGKLVDIKIDFGGLTKPATVFLEKVSGAVGWVANAESKQIVRMAEAEAKADLILAESQIKLTEVQERGLKRVVHEEGKRQENIESITKKAIPLLSEDAKPEEVEDDWITHFFEKSRLTSDDEMQTLWANILSGQANKPGSFSIRTINLVSMLDKDDAEGFTNLCSFIWIIEDNPVAMVLGLDVETVKGAGLNFALINHLEDVGLLTLNILGSYIETDLPKITKGSYFDHIFTMQFEKEDNNKIQTGIIVLSESGTELFHICKSTPNEGYFEEMIQNFEKEKIKINRD